MRSTEYGDGRANGKTGRQLPKRGPSSPVSMGLKMKAKIPKGTQLAKNNSTGELMLPYPEPKKNFLSIILKLFRGCPLGVSWNVVVTWFVAG